MKVLDLLDDDHGVSGGPSNGGNWPSTTGNPSGGGRGNNPPEGDDDDDDDCVCLTTTVDPGASLDVIPRVRPFMLAFRPSRAAACLPALGCNLVAVS